MTAFLTGVKKAVRRSAKCFGQVLADVHGVHGVHEPARQR